MANKKSLLGGVQLKVENMSGFDKSFYHALTAPLGSIVPICKQLLLPGSAELKMKISAQLPPLASDAFLRTHLKVEAFFVPLRLCYGGFASWFGGERIAAVGSSQNPNGSLTSAQLPRINVVGAATDASSGTHYPSSAAALNEVFGPHSLMDYFGVKYPLSSSGVTVPWADPQISGHLNYSVFNAFPFLAYQLCYHHWYRNKLIERPLFAPSASASQGSGVQAVASLPFISYASLRDLEVDCNTSNEGVGVYGFRSCFNNVALLNGHLLQLRQRNYGYDYFTTALPSAQDGQPMTVDTSAGSFTISALRVANVSQHFAEVNQVAGPDFVQVCHSRYGKAPGAAVVQRPVLLGSADFPMYTSGVEQTAPFDTNSTQTGNPFEGLGARYGRAHAEGSDFVCKVDADEPGYLMVMVSLVPDANYAMGIAHDMRMFTQLGSITDLPNHLLEGAGLEPVYAEEIGWDDSDSPQGLAGRRVFGYQPRYMWHKAGNCNMVSGLFRQGSTLASFIPQRVGAPNGQVFTQINTDFLKVNPADLDNITAVAGAVSQYGVMIDSAIELHVSEPLGESVMPSLADPAYEHGHEVYVKRGGVNVDS